MRLIGNWKKSYFPKSGWTYMGFFYEPHSTLCQMCLCQKIKYVHKIYNQEHNRHLNVGIDCCEYLINGSRVTNSIAKQNELIMRNRNKSNLLNDAQQLLFLD